jgi:hypothetical protein
MTGTFARTSGNAPRTVRSILWITVALIVAMFVLCPTAMTTPRHSSFLPRPSTSQTALPRSCIEGTCHEAARAIRAMVTHVLLRLPAIALLLTLLLAVLPLAMPMRVRARLRDWWWPPGRRRALLQVFRI